MENKIKYILIGIMVVVLMVFFGFFQVAGLGFITGFILMPIPFYLFLNRFDLEFDEKVIFSIFISIVAFPLLVWYVNYFLIPSLRVTIVVVYFILFILGMIFRSKKENI